MTSYELPHMKYNEQKGLISIIIPIYNTQEIYLRECLDSVLSQTFTNWETILVNDGSTDNTGKILDEYAKKDSRFIIINKQNEGTLLARKTGLENSRGEYIANMDHDDRYNLQFLQKMYLKIMETNADFAWCICDNPCRFNITDYNWNLDISKNVETVLNTQIGMAFYTWNKLIKREIYAKVLFPSIYLTHGEDPIQIFQIAYHSKSAAFVPEILYLHREGGVTATINRCNFLQSIININETFQILFNGAIPNNVENAFYCFWSNTPYYFFSLSRKERQIFEYKLKPFFPEFIKHQKKLRLKILLLLANKGVEFPLKLYNWIKGMVRHVRYN